MASASSNTRQRKYDVFISFKGADVRETFLSHLFQALSEKQIDAFKDENLERGEQIDPELLQIIEESHISIVIFSENYAYSSWCLDELVKIMNCKKEMGQIVLPVFYRIDPTDVQELTGSYGDAFVKHAAGKLHDKVESWRLALTETAVLSGFVSQDLKPESKLIHEIVKVVLKRLNEAFSSDHCDDGLVGIESPLQDMEQLLDLEATDVRFIGIWGMPGIGKTTLATKVFDRFSSQFQGQCFIANLTEELKHCTQTDLQRKILSKSFGRENLDVGMPIMSSSSIMKWIKRKKVLIVLDDVWDLNLVKFLVGKQYIYASGSRVVITSRDKEILKNIDALIYEMEGLNYKESLQLFSLHALKQSSLLEASSVETEEYSRVEYAARKAVEYAGGNPLALQVLGSNLYGKNVVLWEDQLKKLEKTSDKRIEKILRISYDELGRNEKEIFLDIACFFCSEDKERVERVLESCLGRFARIGISCLLDKCLINISENRLEMHGSLRQMGRDIVEMECVKNPGDRSRLWNPEDIYKVLSNDMGTISVESMSLDITRIRFLELSPTTFVKMRNLRFLRFYSPFYSDDFTYYHRKIKGNIHFSMAGLDYLPDELRYLYWYNYPFKLLPFKFWTENLVELHLIHSNIQQLCNENQSLDNLKVLDLSHSIYLIEVPDFSELPKLEVLCLRGCISLVEIHSSARYHYKLSHLDLRNCKNLCNLPEFIEFTNLDILYLEGCSKLTVFPKAPRNLKHLNLSETAILQVPPSMVHHSCLTTLRLRSCRGLQSLPSSISKLKCLELLDLNGCSNLRELMEVPCNIKYLNLKRTAIQEVPSSIGNCSLLIELNLKSCTKLESLPDALCKLKALTYFNVEKCRILNKLPENLGNLESLERFDASWSGLEKLPHSINSLKSLHSLNWRKCTNLILPPLTGLLDLPYLDLKDCGMTEISICTGSLASLGTLNLNGNLLEKLNISVESLVSLKTLDLSYNHLKELPASIGSLTSLETLNLSNNLLEELPMSIGSLVSLETLNLNENLLEELPTSIGSLVSLTELDLSGNLLDELPMIIGSLASLTNLKLSGNLLKGLPASIGSLVTLTDLHLAGNPFERLPTIIEQLSRLQLLNLQDCKRVTCLSNLPSSLEDLNVKNCRSLESMPSTQGNDFLWFIAAFNCMNLNAKSCRNIMDEMLQRFENFSRQLKIDDFCEVYENTKFTSLYRLGITGDEVPQRMKYRNDNGSSLECPLRQDPFDFIVVNLCAVVASNAHSCSDIAYVECECNLESECGQLFHSHFHFVDWPFHYNWSAEHVFLWQGAIRICSSCIWKKASFKFNVKGEQSLSLDAVVIKCGVDIFYNDKDIDFPSFKHKDWNLRMLGSSGKMMMYGSTEEEAQANCYDCQETWEAW